MLGWVRWAPGELEMARTSYQGGDLIGPAEHGVRDLVSRRWPPYPVALVWWVLLSGFGGVGRLKHIAWLIRSFSF